MPKLDLLITLSQLKLVCIFVRRGASKFEFGDPNRASRKVPVSVNYDFDN